jgi:predicted negative regulator of RcsB-dependent stress response
MLPALLSSLVGNAGIATLLVSIIGAIALGWATFRTQALSAWRSAAEGYKEQVNELTGRLTNAEGQVEQLHAQVTILETRPDMTSVIEALEARSAQNAATVVQAMREMLQPVSSLLADLQRTLSDER